MKRNWMVRGVKVALLVTLAFAVLGFVVMSLWNWLMPALFRWRLISFWQALGLLILSKILFGRFRPRAGRTMHWHRRMLERWEQMTPEEREKFREGVRGRCGHFAPTTTEPKA